MTAQRTKGVDSARRALQILLQFSESKSELTIDNLVERHRISVPSAYRYISLLRELNFIEERSKGVFVLSPQMLRLARAADATLDYRIEAQPILERLRAATGETALYLRRVNDAAVCLAIAESDHPMRISFQPGHLMPLHGGAAAKLLLAEYNDDERSQYLKRMHPRLPDEACSKLEADLQHIRETGVAESAGEVDEGVWASAAPVRVYGTLVGAITVVAPVYRLNDAHRGKVAAAVREHAEELERLISKGR